MRSILDRFWAKVEKTDGCWFWTASVNAHGYGQLSTSRKQGPILAHRFSYELHVGPIGIGLWVLHSCDTPSCVRPDHLFEGNQLLNIADMVNKGRQCKGADKKLAKLTDSTAAVIYTLAVSGEEQRIIAKTFGVSRSRVSRIKNGKAWRHIQCT